MSDYNNNNDNNTYDLPDKEIKILQHRKHTDDYGTEYSYSLVEYNKETESNEYTIAESKTLLGLLIELINEESESKESYKTLKTEYALVSQGILINKVSSKTEALRIRDYENKKWSEYVQQCVDNNEPYADNEILVYEENTVASTKLIK